MVPLSIFTLLRLLHISAAIIFVGGLFARQAVRSLTARASDVAALVALTQAAGRVERLMMIPGNILAIVFGLILAMAIRAPSSALLKGPARTGSLHPSLSLPSSSPLSR